MLSRRGLLAALAPNPAKAFRRGVNFTAERPDVYGSVGARRMLEQLPGYGVDSIALVPFGFTRRGEAAVRVAGARSWESDDGIRDLAAHARKLGMRVLLKPHVWTAGGFPGNLVFENASDRKQWFAAYGLFVDHYAALARDIQAELFSVGNEFVKLSRGPEQEKYWRELIARARSTYKGPITYSSVQGEEFEGIRFWDALDYIGLNNYYPLPDSLDCSDLVRKVEAVQRAYQKPVLFTECGYCSFRAPHREPWDETPRELNPADQARCCEALLKAFYRKPWMEGMYWWKVGTNGFGGPGDGSHTPWRKPAMDVIGKYYKTVKR
jgi:hypothetical protein